MQKNYPQKFDISRAGFLSGLGVPRVRALKNTADTKADYSVLTIPVSPVASTVYSVTDTAGNTATYTTDASPTQSELALGMLDALRNSPIYDLATPKLVGNVLTVTSRSEIDAFSLSGTAAFSIAVFNFGAITPSVPFGVLVARRSTDADDEARLPGLSTDKIVGVAMSTYAIEKTAIGQSAQVAYPANEAMDVLDRCNALDGIWVRCAESDLTISEPLFVKVGGVTAGYLTRSAAGNIALTSASLVKGTVTNSDNSLMVLLSINLS